MFWEIPGTGRKYFQNVLLFFYFISSLPVCQEVAGKKKMIFVVFCLNILRIPEKKREGIPGKGLKSLPLSGIISTLIF